jgi:hypothetical protein
MRRNSRGNRRRDGMAERHLSFERLEHRQLLAVTTSLDRGTLTITGDDAADDIAIVGTSNPGELIVTGRNGTVVNGVANGSTTAFPVFLPAAAFIQPDALKVNLGDGNDSVTIDSAYIAGSININTADGDDTVTLAEHGEVSPTGDLRIDTGAGNDVVAELNYSVFVPRGNLILLGDGHDFATLIGASAVGQIWPYAYSTPAIWVEGGAGNDSILGVGVTATLNALFSGGYGANSLALLNSSGRALHVTTLHDPETQISPGANTIYLDTNYASDITVGTFLPAPLTGLRNNSVSVFRSLCTVLYVQLGYGHSEVNLYGNSVTLGAYNANPTGEPVIVAPALRISSYANILSEPTANAATATVTMSYNAAIEAIVDLTNGNDSLSVTGNFVRTKTSLNGGLGRNTIREWYNHWGSLTATHFG